MLHRQNYSFVSNAMIMCNDIIADTIRISYCRHKNLHLSFDHLIFAIDYIYFPDYIE